MLGIWRSSLEREEGQLSQAVSQAALTGLRINALLSDGQIARARNLLDERREDLVENDQARFQAIITSQEGEDPRSELENIYRRSGELIDLHNLVRCLGQARDWIKLKPLLSELFSRERKVDNALMLVDCMRHISGAGEVDVLTFLMHNHDLVDRSQDLSSAKAWALFHTGHMVEAKAENDKLLSSRNGLADVHLDINLALQSGDWERFPAIVDREWDRKEECTPDILLRLSTIAAEGDATEGRAFELAQLAASKAPDDPKV